MKILKFNESLNIDEINDFLIDLKDIGIDVNPVLYQGKLLITGENVDSFSKIEVYQEILNLYKRIESLGYESNEDEFYIYIGQVNDKMSCKFRISFIDTEHIINKDTKSFDEFRDYLEKFLNLEFHPKQWERFLANDLDTDGQITIPHIRDFRDYFSKEKVFCLNFFLKEGLKKKNQKPFFSITLEKGTLSSFSSKDVEFLSKVVLTSEESKSNKTIPESKKFSFNREGIEIIEKVIEIFKNSP